MLMHRTGRFRKSNFQKCRDTIYDLGYIIIGCFAYYIASILKIGVEYESSFEIKLLFIIASIICNLFVYILFYDSIQCLKPAKTNVLTFCFNFLFTVI
jgi:hypothetical protein